MSPIYPIKVPVEQINNGTWVTLSEYANLILHIRNLCNNYPSLILAFSADFDSRVYSNLIAECIIEWGINVFMPEFPVPLSALSYTLTTKSMPIGLYVEELKDENSVRIIPISSHGGLFDNQDLKTSHISAKTNKGVIGATDIATNYIKHLSGFADPFIEEGLSFSNFDNPFKELIKLMEHNESLKILFERDELGPKAFINNNGCLLKVSEKDSYIPTIDIAKKIAMFLKKERFSSGTLLVPFGTKDKFLGFDEIVEVEGNYFDLSYSAAFSDLFLGWWPDGMIAMQGSSCFGDGLLASIYYLESLR